jgi:hypothetical protein
VVAQTEANVTSWRKGYSKPRSHILGSHEEPQLEQEGYLRAIMLEANSVQLLTFEPKVVKKVHPGAERSMLLRDSVTRFFASGFFHESVSPQL